MDRPDLDRISDMKDYCERVMDSVARFGESLETFQRDVDFYQSVSMSLVQLGEASSSLSDSFKSMTKGQVPWSLIKGMRNMIAHSQFGIDERQIWKTATTVVPNLLKFCVNALERESKRTKAERQDGKGKDKGSKDRDAR